MAPRRRSPLVTVLVVLAFAVAGAWAAGPAAAQTGERIHRYDVSIRVEADGSLLITEVIEYDFGSNERRGIFREIPVRLRYDDTYDRVYRVEDLSVETSPGAPDDVQTTEEGGILRVRIGDPDVTITGRHTYTIRYRVIGGLNGFVEHDELYWNAVGANWSVPIDEATAEVVAPAAIPRIACFSGPQGSSLPCDRSEVRGGTATFSSTGLFPFSALTVVVALPKGAVADPAPILEERWSLSRAFSVTPLSVGLALAVLAVLAAGFGVIAWRTGRDRRAIGSAVDVAFAQSGAPEQTVPLFEAGEFGVEYAPPDGLRPGQVGTLIDEVAHPLDVTATIVDLAVRGYLRIEEIPKTWLFGKNDWRLVKLKEAQGLLEYERLTFSGLFRDADETDEGGHRAVRMSSLRRKFHDQMQKIQQALYRDTVRQGWFAGSPDKVRLAWSGRGVLITVVGIGLVYAAARWTHLALVPVPIVLGGLAVLAFSRKMPRRTPAGTGMVRRVTGFRRYIATAEADQARFAERANLFYQYLPFAVVFGLTEKWARAFSGLADQMPDPTWYSGPHAFSVHSFSESIDSFTVSSTGTLVSTPSGSGSSGFGGGGSSGGGGGGGGGGSW